jgi:hypothetical protein
MLACFEADIRPSVLPGYVVARDFLGGGALALYVLSMTMYAPYENAFAKKIPH